MERDREGGSLSQEILNKLGNNNNNKRGPPMSHRKSVLSVHGTESGSLLCVMKLIKRRQGRSLSLDEK